jgi:hypothetical protein
VVFIPGSRVPQDSWLGRWFGRRSSPDQFSCGVRVVAGELPGEGPDWSYRPSALDPTPGELVLVHGDVRLRLRELIDEPDVAARPGLRVWRATETVSGAWVQLAARADAFAT